MLMLLTALWYEQLELRCKDPLQVSKCACPSQKSGAHNSSAECERPCPCSPLHKFCLMGCAQETSLADLQLGQDNLQRELKERTGQLKALVKENFDHFISCKTTIDDIHKRLRQAEKGQDGGNASYVSTHDVIETVSEVGSTSVC